ncbi:uncharacterized protein Dana_GF27414 [Drosophila ananassae]|uniref:BPTI/Kunitz inhibitor domain-containing protein n=1 Tax=Drosophila ananassae TaxID=7217 RepID=A0A0N8P128_DROAN|nr:WAP four-disulfide core domain protein 8 [Drosophila ananassae]KPU78764.1 uncharacterized protein Dana_GF27414 [Drosophila ananassae]
MKVLFIALFVTQLPYYMFAQENCVGRPGRQLCYGRSHVGFNKSKNCNNYGMDEMWYFDTKVKFCRTMEYLGCGGNNNRYCSRDHCRQRCDPYVWTTRRTRPPRRPRP